MPWEGRGGGGGGSGASTAPLRAPGRRKNVQRLPLGKDSVPKNLNLSNVV